MREKLRHVGEKEKIQCFTGILAGERENWEQAVSDYQETKNLCKKTTTKKTQIDFKINECTSKQQESM